MYMETPSRNHGQGGVFVSWERTDIIQTSNITFYYNRYPISNNDSLKSMGRFRIHFLLAENIWSTRYNIHKNHRYNDTSTDWTLLSLNFTLENFGNKLIYDQIDFAHGDTCFSKFINSHSVY